MGNAPSESAKGLLIFGQHLPSSDKNIRLASTVLVLHFISIKVDKDSLNLS